MDSGEFLIVYDYEELPVLSLATMHVKPGCEEAA